jgi:hypothetical protein
MKFMESLAFCGNKKHFNAIGIWSVACTAEDLDASEIFDCHVDVSTTGWG